MLKRNLWKLTLSFAIVLWAVWTLLPLNDQPFPDYAKSQSRAKTAEFAALLKEAGDRRTAGTAASAFVALKDIAKERKLDLSQYFPNLDVGDVKNLDRKNSILLDYLLKQSKGKVQLGLDLKGGVGVTLEVDPNLAATKAGTGERDQKEKLDKAIEIISNRINAYGVTEPLVRAVGTNRIEILLPGVNTRDNPEILADIKKPARLDFRLVHPFLTPATSPNEIPPGYEIMTLENERRTGETSVEEVFVKRIPEMTGEGIDKSFAHYDQFGKPEISLQLTKEGRKQFARITGEIAGYTQQLVQRTGNQNARARLAIVLDGKLYSAPGVEKEIDGDAVINGSFTDREAKSLADALNNPLDLPLVVKDQYEVGPSLAADAMSSGLKAAVIGTVLVAGFMVTYYWIGGMVAVLTLGINMLVLFGLMAMFGATLTMPGLAGIVLTVGMAVDANILIFERMRDELNLGKSLKSALVSGYDKAFITIVDAHVTQVLICFVMIWLGHGPIKGFGVTLAMGVFSTLFSTLIVSHLILEWLIEKDIVTKFPMMHFFHSVNVDFVKWFKPAFIISMAIVLIGVGTVIYKGNAIYGIDFSGGDVTKVSFSQKLDVAEIRRVATQAGLKDVGLSYQNMLGDNKEVLKLETVFGQSENLLSALQKAHPEAKLVKEGTNQIGPSIGGEIKMNAVYSISLSLLVIMIYIAFRFEVGFGIGAVVSTLHDIFMTIGIFVIAGHQFSAPMVAAILCIAGYSINDTVVVFDRIREELRLNPNMKLNDVINLSVRRVFSRSLMTSFTSFLATLSLFIFGGGVIHDLSFTFLVGIITGTFSSIFIAAPIFYWWHKGDRKHVEKHQDVKPTYEWTGSSKASQ
jgi:SecD/SecF fusion protein